MKLKIIEYDKGVITALNAKPGRPIKPRSVKSIRSDINQPFFSCKHCDDAFNRYSKLKRHKFTEHSVSINSLGNSLLSIKHSTRNNSLSEEMLLCDDVTLFVDSETVKPTLEVDTKKEPEFQCNMCEHGSENENDLQIHIQSHDRKLKCDYCSHQATNEMDLSLHIAKVHPPKIICDDCAFTALSSHDMENHVNMQHKVKELHSCIQCEFDSEDIMELKEHNARDIHDIKN